MNEKDDQGHSSCSSLVPLPHSVPTTVQSHSRSLIRRYELRHNVKKDKFNRCAAEKWCLLN